jgi:hypothetical protein
MIFLAIFHAEALIPRDLFSTKGAMPVFACHKIPRRVRSDYEIHSNSRATKSNLQVNRDEGSVGDDMARRR